MGASALFGLLLALLGWGVGGVLVGSCALGALAAGLIVWDRLWLTSGVWYSTWVQSLLCAGLFTLLVWLVGGWLLRRRANLPGRWSLRGLPFRILLTIMLVAFAVRLAGQLHPQIFVVDLLYHVHRYEDVQNGTLIIMHVASELAGRDTFYLPTAYIFMMPLQWVVGRSGDVRAALYDWPQHSGRVPALLRMCGGPAQYAGRLAGGRPLCEHAPFGADLLVGYHHQRVRRFLFAAPVHCVRDRA